MDVQEFAVIPGEIYETLAVRPAKSLGALGAKVLGFRDNGEVVTRWYWYKDESLGTYNECTLQTFRKLHLPLGQRLATTTELAVYNGGRA